MQDLEHQEAVALITWWTLFARSKKLDDRLLYHIPNGGHRHPVVAGKLKAEGVRPGAPDYFLAVRRPAYGGLYIELKSKEGSTSDSQDSMLALLRAQGYACVVCRGWDAASKEIEAYLKTPA